KCLKIQNTAVPPKDGFFLLDGEQHLDLVEAIRIDAAFEAVPRALQPANRVDTFIIFANESVPKCFPGFQLVIPGYMMEPEQVFFGTRLQAIKLFGNRWKILSDGIAS